MAIETCTTRRTENARPLESDSRAETIQLFVHNVHSFQFGAALEAGFSEFDIYGALGGKRISHSLANIQTLAYLGSAGAKGRLIGNGTVISLLSAGESTGCDLRGDLSVLALEAARVSIQGALYSGTFALSPSFPLGVSNRCDGKVSVSVLEGRVLVIEEQDT